MLKNLLQSAPVTRSTDEVRGLLAKAALPVSIALNQEEILVLSAKKDAYYTVTPEACSCPASVYNPGPCKHRKRYFPEEAALEERKAKKLAMPPDSLRPEGKWPGGYNGPWVE